MPGTTPIYGLRYQLPGDSPEGDDLGLNLATDVENLVTNWLRPLVDQRTTATANITTTTLVTALTVTVPVAGQWHFTSHFNFQNQTGAGRPAFALGGTSVASQWRWAASTVPPNAVVGQYGGTGNGTTWPGATAGTNLGSSTIGGSADYAALWIVGTFTITTPGTVTWRFAQNTGSNPLVIRDSSSVICHRIA